ncbi:NEDD8-activating enzyme E1 regulatory subunit [Paraphysoderma sedebokerense]|nr:NEDD8-activating enzyme E1 regulatory subunit [Paraphysoderma sedebokerense]
MALVPDHKTQKYDRQLRLWASTGQTALEMARVLLINGTATGTEILKNLVLPGVGSFTVLDNTKVEVEDLGNNFFVRADDLGRSKAETVTELLCELNEDVDGQAVVEDPVELIENNPSFFSSFTLIVVTGFLSPSALLKLSKICDTNTPKPIPMIVVRTCGFVGLFRTVVKEHPVVETHPENVKDLRLDAPWPELIEFVNSFPQFEAIDSMQYSHLPYVVILLRYLLQWRQKYNKSLPETRDEKDSFRNLVKSGIRQEKATDLENWNEAVSNVHRVFSRTIVPSDVTKLFNDPKCSEETDISGLDNFWVIARAVKSFVEHEGQGFLPLSGKVPDMKADTETFVKLQMIYRQKAQSDFECVKSKVQKLLSQTSKPTDTISDDDILTFCKNSPFVTVLRMSSLESEYSAGAKLGVKIARKLENHDNHVSIYVLFRAVDLFYETHKRYPAAHVDEIDTDTPLLKRSVNEVLKTMDIPPNADTASVLDEWVQEFARAGTSELHNIAAFFGGVGSQEVIKLITQQYIPASNTFIFNGIDSTTVELEM